jgi:PAS domain S-box-containing protein
VGDNSRHCDGNFAGRCAAEDSLTVKARPGFEASMASLCIKGNSVAISLGNPYLQDCELVATSDFFSTLTGYSREEVIGRNCRFLNRHCNMPDEVRHKLRVAVLTGVEVTQVIPNRTKSGQLFANLLTMTSVRVGDRMYILGVQINDETERGLSISSNEGYFMELQTIVERIFDLGVEKWAERQLENFCMTLPHAYSVRLAKLTLLQNTTDHFLDHTFVDTTGWAVSCKNSFLHVEDEECDEDHCFRIRRSSSIPNGPKISSSYSCVAPSVRHDDDGTTSSCCKYAIQTPDTYSDDDAYGG